MPSLPARADSRLRPSTGAERIQRLLPTEATRGHLRPHDPVPFRTPQGRDPFVTRRKIALGRNSCSEALFALGTSRLLT